MITVKTFLIIAFGINLLAVAFLSFHQYSKLDQSYYSYQFHQKTTFSFDDPFKAFYLLERLDVHSAIGDKELFGANYTIPAGGLKLNFDYCSENRAYFVNHPEELFQKQNVVINYRNFHQLIKKVLPMIDATDVHPDIFPRKDLPPKSYVYDLKPQATVFYMHNLFFYWRQIGKQWSCLAQASNHIPGHDKIYRKDYGAQALVDYAATYKSRPRCFTFNEFFPKTWVLKKKDQCENFFAEFNSPRYQQMKEERNVVYFRKIGADAHEGSGVFPVTDEEEAKIRALYKNGSLCGSIQANNLIQYNVWNPLLLENRKFGFRMFMLIASTNPVIAYYHDGYLRLSLDEYNANSKDIKTFVTNIGVNMKEAKKKDSIFSGMTEGQINEYTCWSLEKFQDYLFEKGIIHNKNWLDSYLRPQFKRVMIHLIRMSQDAYFKKSSVFELYGLDFVMDADLGLWYIETNTMPLVNGFTKDTVILMNRMLADTFEIIFGLVRSRMKRVIIYINQLSKEFGGQSYTIPDLETKREEFRKITMNHFEPEFEPSVGNTFQKIVDENEVGTAKYLNLISSDCL